MGQSKLESLMLLSCERDIELNINDAINTFGATSDLLRKNVLFK